MKRVILSLILLAILPLAAACTGDVSAKPTQVADRHAAQVARGQYLVNFGGCHDCHTPLKMGPKGPEPDMARMLSGHPHDLVMTPPPKTEGPWMATGSVTMTARTVASAPRTCTRMLKLAALFPRSLVSPCGT